MGKLFRSIVFISNAYPNRVKAPFSIVGEEINRLNICGPANSYRPQRLSGAYGPLNHHRNFEYDEDVEMEEATENPIPSDTTLTTVNPEVGSDDLAGV